MKYADNITSAGELLPDYMGFIFYLGSSRYAGREMNVEAVKNLPASIRKVGVFVNPERIEVIHRIARYRLDMVQLHGDESPEFCKEIRLYTPVIKAFGVDEKFDFAVTEAYSRVCERFIFDTKSPGHGGSGKTFNWQQLAQYKGKTPFLLSGGINLLHAKALPELMMEYPMLEGIDVNSRFEVKAGLKSIDKLKKLTQLLRVEMK